MHPRSVSPSITAAKPVDPCDFYREHFAGERRLAERVAVTSKTASKQRGTNV